jgi:hypothetical protein
MTYLLEIASIYDDIRYMIHENTQDSEYLNLAKDPQENASKLKNIVDNRAKQSNYNSQYNHGTRNLNFKDLKLPDPADVMFARYGPAIYLANPNEQKTLNVYSKNGRVLSLFVDTKNFIDKNLSSDQVSKILQHFDYNIKFKDDTKSGDWVKDIDRLEDIGALWQMLDISGHSKYWYDYMKLIGVDGVIRPFAGYDDGELAVYNKKTIKSADPITYDDQGNIIPLSQRFNPAVNDIRY